MDIGEHNTVIKETIEKDDPRAITIELYGPDDHKGITARVRMSILEFNKLMKIAETQDLQKTKRGSHNQPDYEYQLNVNDMYLDGFVDHKYVRNLSGFSLKLDKKGFESLRASMIDSRSKINQTLGQVLEQLHSKTNKKIDADGHLSQQLETSMRTPVIELQKILGAGSKQPVKMTS